MMRSGVTNMNRSKNIGQRLAAAMLVTSALVGAAAIAPAPSKAAAESVAANGMLTLSVGRGRLITLPRAMEDVFVADQQVANVQVRSKTQLYIFGKGVGETSVYATDKAGRVIYSTVVRVGNNIETLDQMLTLAMPDADIQTHSMNGFVLLTGTVKAPEDAAEADRLVQAMVGDDTKVISRLQTATPLQVNLQVRIAEVSKTLVKELGANVHAEDETGGTMSAIYSGADGAITETTNGYTLKKKAAGSTFGIVKRLLGMNVAASLDLAERNGLVTTLAQPNLTAMSGETADFLAGGEFPVPVANSSGGLGGNTVTVEFRKYGVSLSYTPTVLSNGRISMRVRPEVSELSTEGAIKMNGFDVPSLTIRRTETTVELGSGESFMIAGLMSNKALGLIDKTPGVGDVPIIGNLFKSDSFRRGETELVIMITPYLVKPVNANDIRLPTDAFRSGSDVQRVFMNQTADGVTGGQRPMPTRRDGSASPAIGAAQPSASDSKRQAGKDENATPGFDFGK